MEVKVFCIWNGIVGLFCLGVFVLVIPVYLEFSLSIKFPLGEVILLGDIDGLCLEDSWMFCEGFPGKEDSGFVCSF